MSQLVHTLSMDERHQRRRLAIMAAAPQQGVSVLSSSSPISSSSSPSVAASMRAAEAEAKEQLDEFETTALTFSGVERLSDDSSGSDLLAQSAPFRAGLRGFVHGVVGGVTSIVTQPIHGACEKDSLKVFVSPLI